MKSCLLLSLLLIASGISLFAQSYNTLVRRADSLYRAKDYKASHTTYSRAFKIEKKLAGDLYNAACAAALAGDSKDAFALVNLAMTHGWANVKHLTIDSDLTSLHSDAQWKPLVAKMQVKNDSIEANYDKPLQAELLKILQEDQAIRRLYIAESNKLGFDHPRVDSLGKVMQHTDSINLVRVKPILDEKGWVGPGKVGKPASQALFLVIQHSDLATQEKYLPMMREAVKKGDAGSDELALLEDRVALRKGNKQTYGTQLHTNSETKQLYVAAMIDPDHVDERRDAVRLGPMAEYVRRWNIVWNVEEYKKQLPEYERLLKENAQK
ncbi:DUF6624 domain-containing protein [Chryseolinea sp. T2]|uniref:DUF6624 domain-containing protein n=1 Tax=Chryseolinea sp. T2 TaxID=3129255 RepID=UPI003076D5D0